MQNSHRFWRSLFFILLVTALCGGLALPVVSSPARAAPQIQVAIDLVISEFRFRGSGGASGANAAADEFIEIFNPTVSAVNLNGWQIRGSSSTGSSGSRYAFSTDFFLQPGQHYLIAHTNYNDSVAADVTYPSGIADDGGVALVRPDSTIADQAGMTAACPPNTCYVEGTQLTSLGSTNADRSYERQLDISGSCTDANNNASDFFLRNPSDPQNSSSPITTCGNPTPMPSPTSTATSTATATGTPTNTATATSTGAPTNTATATATASPSSAVLINEVAWAGTLASSDDEWIELYNPSSTVTVDLTGWVLKSTDNTPNISLTGSLAPNSFLVLAKNGGTFQAPVPSTTNNTITLSNSGEILSLVDASGRTIDTANSDGGSWPAGLASPTYASMERVGTANQWITYAGTSPVAYDRNNNPVKGTPGRSNWITTTTFTTITSDSPDPSVINQNVTVTVTVIGGPTPPSGTVSITGANTNCSITLSNGTGSCVVKFTSAGAKTIIATYPDPSHPSSDTESHSVTTTAVARTPTRVPTPLPPPPLIGINEFVPRPGHDWNLDGVINVGDEYIELINHGVIDVNLNGYSLDDEVNIGSAPFRLPSVTLKPGERKVFYGSETGLLLSDGGDGVRLLKPNGQLGDAYNYFVVRFPDQSYCRLPDNGGLDDWNRNCFPTPGLQNSLSVSSVNPPTAGDAENLCPIADTLPPDFVYAECLPFGNNIWNSAYWDRFGWFGEKSLPESPGKWSVYVD